MVGSDDLENSDNSKRMRTERWTRQSDASAKVLTLSPTSDHPLNTPLHLNNKNILLYQSRVNMNDLLRLQMEKDNVDSVALLAAGQSSTDALC